jgi:hypothetical protein
MDGKMRSLMRGRGANMGRLGDHQLGVFRTGGHKCPALRTGRERHRASSRDDSADEHNSRLRGHIGVPSSI